MYVRVPNSNRQKIKIPENYSGNAFSQAPRLNDMPPPVRQAPPRYDLPPTDVDEITETEPYTDGEIEKTKQEAKKRIYGSKITQVINEVKKSYYFPFLPSRKKRKAQFSPPCFLPVSIFPLIFPSVTE